jgi:hypothetical protein
MMGSLNKPTQFIDQITGGDRIALFYEDREYARMLDFRYIKNGLLNGEQCIYLALDRSGGQEINSNNNNYHRHQDRKEVYNLKGDNSNHVLVFLKRDMADNDIDVAHFLAEGSLHIGTIVKQQLLDYCKKSSSRKNGYELLKSMLPRSFFGTDEHSSPISAVELHRLVLDLGLESNANHELLLPDILKFEEACHFAFHSLHGSSICNYPLQDIEAALIDYSDYGKLVNIRLNNHNGVIFARKFGKGLALALE